MIVVTLALAAAASAPDFPPDAAWDALPCADDVMTDPYRDEPGATDERDLVGDVNGPTGLRAADATHAYFRMRLDQDPIPDGHARPFAWGILLDADGDRATYEALVLVNGLDEVVGVYRNTETTLPDAPVDPPDGVPIAERPLRDVARTVEATGSRWGNDPDTFLDVAVPWEDLGEVGIGPLTPVVAWYVTSSTDTALDGDLACHDGLSGGDPSLSDASPDDDTVLDPGADSDGDGWSDAAERWHGSDPHDRASVPVGVDPDAPILEGGGGCATVRAPASSWVLVAALALLRRRRPTRLPAARRRGTKVG